MLKIRFVIKDTDCRPVTFPPPHPWWRTGQGDGYFTCIAYADSIEQLRQYWPDAEDIDVFEEVATYSFTSRFPKPDWFQCPPQQQ